MYKRKLRFHTFRIKSFLPPPFVYPPFWHEKNTSSKNLQKYVLIWQIYDQKEELKSSDGGQKLLIRKVWYNIPAFFYPQNYVNGNFQLKHGLRFFWIYFHWKSHLPYFTKFVFWVFCRPQRGKWSSMGCIKSNFEILKCFAKSTNVA